MTFLCTEFPPQPAPGEAPVTLNGYSRDVQGGGDFVGRKTAEVAQFDYTRFAGIDPSEALQRLVQYDHAGGAVERGDRILLNRDELDRAATFLGLFGAGIVD